MIISPSPKPSKRKRDWIALSILAVLILTFIIVFVACGSDSADAEPPTTNEPRVTRIQFDDADDVEVTCWNGYRVFSGIHASSPGASPAIIALLDTNCPTIQEG